MSFFFPIARKLIPPTMTRSLFVRNARSLEKLKTVAISDETFATGKYLVFLKDSVLVDPKTKSLAWKNYQSKYIVESFWLQGDSLLVYSITKIVVG